MVPPGWYHCLFWWSQTLGGGLQLSDTVNYSLSLSFSYLSLFPYFLASIPPPTPFLPLSFPLKIPRIIQMSEGTKAEKQRRKDKIGSCINLMTWHESSGLLWGHPNSILKMAQRAAAWRQFYLSSCPSTWMCMEVSLPSLKVI